MRLQTAKVNKAGLGGASAPLTSYVVDGYVEGEVDHVGADYWAVDFDTNATDPAVYPVRPGKVIYSNYNSQSSDPDCAYGFVVLLDHGSGIYSIYAHLADDNEATVGATVSVTDRIGTMSDSGCPKGGTHLHFALRYRPGVTDPTQDPPLFEGDPIQTPWHKGG
jgi:murein DD-endopeptidase MepM/ murein hydrolase activator NlpD